MKRRACGLGRRSVYINTPLPQVFLRHLDLPHQFLVGFRYIMEGENVVPKLP